MATRPPLCYYGDLVYHPARRPIYGVANQSLPYSFRKSPDRRDTPVRLVDGIWKETTASIPAPLPADGLVVVHIATVDIDGHPLQLEPLVAALGQ